MMKLKKGYNYCIVFLLTAIFSLTTTISSYPVSFSDSSLRIPLAGKSKTELDRQKSFQREVFLEKCGLSKDTKKPTKILLIQPRLATQKSKPTRLPAGLMSLASALRDRVFIKQFCDRLGKEEFDFKNYDDCPEFTVQILDLQAEAKDFDLSVYLEENRPDAVCFTASTPAIDDAAEESLIVENTLPNAVQIIGGPHASALPLETLSRYSFNIVVPGEGIETLLELLLELRLDRPDLSQVNGLYYNDITGNAIATLPRKRLMHLDEYPLPAFSVDLLKIDGYEELVNPDGVNAGQAAVLFTSTGCPFGKCIFCASKAVFGRIVDKRSAENIFKEIKYFYDKGFRAFYILDDLFTLDRKRIEKLGDMIEESGIKIQYSMMTRADAVNQEVATDLKKTGCKVAALGVESGDQELLDKVIDKGIALNKVRSATQLLKRAGIHVKYFMMVGLPDQGWESVRKSAYFILENEPDSMNVAIAMPYPGSDLYKDDRIKILDESEGYRKYQHEAEPQLKDKDRINGITETNVMTNEEIVLARDILADIYQYRYNSDKLGELLDELDYLVAAKPISKLVLNEQSGLKHDKEGINNVLLKRQFRLNRAI